ncbi:hypothetical protein N7527_007197 [Penicillium freii]|nr:hypothetical protein N7527_007197 [Penicillium freii]
MTPHQRSTRFQADFDQHGDIRTGRLISGSPSVQILTMRCIFSRPPEAVQASLEDSLIQLTLRAFDTTTYPKVDRTNGPVDLIHVATISRGQNKIPCRFIMNTCATTDINYTIK